MRKYTGEGSCRLVVARYNRKLNCLELSCRTQYSHDFVLLLHAQQEGNELPEGKVNAFYVPGYSP